MSFVEMFPNTSNAHFEFIPKSGEVSVVNVLRFPNNIATFLDSEMRVARVATGMFRTDLTEDRDDIFVAILSLLLLLCMQGIITSILLRVAPGRRVSNQAFSLTQFLHLVRDFRVRHLFRGRGSVARKMAVDTRLAVIAIFLLVGTFAVEFLILFFTSPELVPVTNEVASLTLAMPVAPNWKNVRTASGSTTTPCSVTFMSGVEQRGTRITPCLTSSISQFEPGVFTEKFDDSAKPIQMNITSDLHEYGMKHSISIGDDSAQYSAMAYCVLNDEKGRIVPNRIVKGNRQAGMKYVHNMLIGFLFSAYKNDTSDSRITAELLTKLKIKTENTQGPDVYIIKINNAEKFVRVVSDRYTTIVKGAPPIAHAPALSFARTVLKSTIAIRVMGPDVVDLLMGSGSKAENIGVLWYESSRSLNWLTLIVLLLGALLVLVWVRLSLQSISASDIAGMLVKDIVHADKERSPIEMEDDEVKSFYAGITWNGTDYHFGAEASDGELNSVEGAYGDIPITGSSVDGSSSRRRQESQLSGVGTKLHMSSESRRGIF